MTISRTVTWKVVRWSGRVTLPYFEKFLGSRAIAPHSRSLLDGNSRDAEEAGEGGLSDFTSG